MSENNKKKLDCTMCRELKPAKRISIRNLYSLYRGVKPGTLGQM